MTINTASQSEADAPVKRGRGRPPGSKNKPKPQPEAQAKLAKPETSTVLPATPSIETTDLQSVPDILPPRRLTDDEYLDQAEGEIRGYGRNVVQTIVAIGKKLVEVKERVGHGKYDLFVRDRLDFSDRTARQFVQSYEFLKSAQCADFDSLQIDASAIRLLARPSTPEEVRTAALEKAETEGISHAEVQKLSADAKAEAAAKTKDEAEGAAAEKLAAVKRAGETAAKNAADNTAALAEVIRGHELSIAQSRARIAELEAAAETLAQSVRTDIEAQYSGKVVISEDELRSNVEATVKKSTAPLERQCAEEKKRADEADKLLADINRRHDERIKAAAEKAAAVATQPSAPPIDSKLYSRSMDAGRAIEYCVTEIKLSPSECIAIEKDVATRLPGRSGIARDNLGNIAAAIGRLEPWFDKFLELFEQETLNEASVQPPASTSTTPSNNDWTVSFRVPKNSRGLAKTLLNKLTPEECREVANSLYDHLGTPAQSFEASAHASDHCQLATDVLGLLNVPEQIDLFRGMLSRWGKSELSSAYDALAVRVGEVNTVSAVVNPK